MQFGSSLATSSTWATRLGVHHRGLQVLDHGARGSVQQVQLPCMESWCWLGRSVVSCCTCCTVEVSTLIHESSALRPHERTGPPCRRTVGEKSDRTEVGLAESERVRGPWQAWFDFGAAKTRSAAPRSISDGSFPCNFPTPAPPASPPVQRQPTPMNLPLSSSVPQPVKSPRQSPYTSGIHSAKAAYRGNDRPKPSQFIGRQSPASKGEKGASDDGGTHRGGAPWPVATSAWLTRCECPMVHPKGRPWYAAQCRIRVATKSIHQPRHRRNGQRNRYRTRHSSGAGHQFPDALGWSRIPSPETVRPTPEGTEDAVCRAREAENPRRDVRSKGTARDHFPLCESPSFKEER